jgi:hypothetical protein
MPAEHRIATQTTASLTFIAMALQMFAALASYPFKIYGEKEESHDIS